MTEPLPKSEQALIWSGETGEHHDLCCPTGDGHAWRKGQCQWEDFSSGLSLVTPGQPAWLFTDIHSVTFSKYESQQRR